jgi:hypothetical protein
VWVKGTSNNLILWNDNLNSNLVILLYKGESLVDTLGTTTNEFTTFLNWNISMALIPGNDYRIVIKDTEGNTAGNSESFSLIEPFIRVTMPLPGVELRRGTNQIRISWENNFFRACLVLLTKNNLIRDTIGYPANDYQYFVYWDIPLTMPYGTDYKILVKDTLNGTTGWSEYFTIDWATKSNDVIDKEALVSIYPNPATNILNVEVDRLSPRGAEIKLFNLAGQCLITKKLLKPKTEISIEFLPRGIYTGEIKNGNSIYTKKLLLK